MKLSVAIKRTRKVLGLVNDYSLISFQDNNAVQIVIEAAERVEKLIRLQVIAPLPIEQQKKK